MRFKGFIGPSYTMRSLNVDCQRCVNLYPELNESSTARPGEVGALCSTPGLRLLATVGDGPIRGVYTTSDGRLFVVSGRELYSVTSAWVATSVGSLQSGSGRVGMVDNGKTLFIVDGVHGYTYDGVFRVRAEEGFSGGTNCDFLDGYVVTNQPGTQYFWITENYGASVSGADFAASEGSPDELVTLLVNNRELWCFGSSSTDIFYNSGNPDFPFDRIQGGFIQHGCVAKWSPARLDNTVFWLGGDDRGNGIVWAAQGYQPRRISTHAMEQAIQRYSKISDATAYSYQQDGHGFYVLNFPSGNISWVYDIATGLWHERAWLDNHGDLLRHRADCHAFAYGEHVVGDWENGKVYSLDKATFTDSGDEIVRMRTSPHATADLKRVFYSSFQLDLETGVGTDGTNQGNDPQVMLQFSDDAGHTWSNEKWLSAGAIGTTKSRVIWRRLGCARDRVFRVKITDPVSITLLGAELNAVAGDK